MKKSCLLSFIASLVLCFNLFAQTKLTIFYKLGIVKDSAVNYKTLNYHFDFGDYCHINEFTINDSTTYTNLCGVFYSEPNIKKVKQERKNIILGKTFSSHSTYNNYAQGISIDSRYSQYSYNGNYLVKD